jgi:crossover junction endodeoxyribonuclease RusA
MITLTLPYPISANRYWASRCVQIRGKWMPIVYVTSEAKDFKEQVGWIGKAAGVGKPIDDRVKVHLELYPHRPLDFKTRMRKHGARWDDTVQCIDLGNAEKVLSDALQGIIFTNDHWIWDLHKKRMEPDEHGARVVLRIEQIVVPVVQPDLLGAMA